MAPSNENLELSKKRANIRTAITKAFNAVNTRTNFGDNKVTRAYCKQLSDSLFSCDHQINDDSGPQYYETLRKISDLIDEEEERIRLQFENDQKRRQEEEARAQAAEDKALEIKHKREKERLELELLTAQLEQTKLKPPLSSLPSSSQSPTVVVRSIGDEAKVSPFDGTPSRYQTFEEEFTSQYETDASLNDAAKFLAFKNLCGNHGKEVIGCLKPTADGLATAKERMQEWFSEPTRVRESIRRSFEQLKPIKNRTCTRQLTSLLITAEEGVQALKNCGTSAATINETFLNLIVQNLPQSLTSTYHRDHVSWDADQFLDHLRKEIKHQEGFNGKTTNSERLVNATLTSITNGQSMDIVFSVVPSLNNLMPPVCPPEFRNLLVAKGYQLTDSHERLPIGMIIGVEKYEFIRKSSTQITEDLHIVDTIFGPTLYGCTPMPTLSNPVYLSVIQTSNSNPLPPIEKKYLEEFSKNNISFENNQYSVKLPWIRPVDLHSYKDAALCRLKRLLNSLKSRGLLSQYTEAMNEVINNFAERAPIIHSNRTYYLAHHCVLRPDKTTSQIRIVFDGSAHEPDRLPLNDCIYKGVNSWNSLNLLLRFRFGKTAIAADIEKAFLTIKVDPSDRDALRFWWINENNEPIAYRFTSASMNVRKWRSNNPTLDHLWSPGAPDSSKTLGHHWNIPEDMLSLETNLCIESTNSRITKRIFSSILASVYDPMGLIAPFVVQLRLFLRKLWKAELDWDDTLPQELHDEALTLINDVHLVKKFTVKRNVITGSPATLLLYCDASKHAVGVAAYTMTETSTELIFAKSQLARDTTMPELELDALLMSAEVANYLCKLADLTSDSIKFNDVELDDLKTKNPINKTSLLHNYKCVLDESNLIRLQTRMLKGPNLTDDETSPSVLPHKCHLSDLLIQFEHDRLGHPGVDRTLAAVRSRVFIIKLRKSVVHLISRCRICRTLRGKTSTVDLGSIPRFRYDERTPAFTNVGLDIFGPLTTAMTTPGKRYGVIFACATTRAVHLELISNQTAAEVYLALRKFVARRGIPKLIYSDNGLQLIAVEKRFLKLVHQLSREYSKPELRLKWIHLTPLSPWRGGFYERLIATVKATLKALTFKTILTDRKLETILYEIEALMNSRPLFTFEGQVVTPAHFFAGRSLVQLPRVGNTSNIDKPDIIKEYLANDRHKNAVWSKFHDHYLLQLKSMHQNLSLRSKIKFKPNDVVLLKNSTPPDYWPIGIIEHVQPSPDGQVRTVFLRTTDRGKTVVKARDVRTLIPLECHGESDTEPPNLDVELKEPDLAKPQQILIIINSLLGYPTPPESHK
ncbi:hypothetical protein TYRP_017757 [Tyrophagus putrescentiae]|nr:hypothetical protein TYRP_017757 [Tyrophagus putrescentiae]